MPSSGENRNSQLPVFALGLLAFAFTGMLSDLRAQDPPSKGSQSATSDQPQTTRQTAAAVSLLKPTEDVNFSSYVQHVVTSVEDNWYALIYDSARNGEKGTVTLKLRIRSDGSMVPEIEKSSGIRTLDKAAMKAVRKAAPFEALPPEFHGPFIELRLLFIS